MFQSMTGWLGGTKPDDDDTQKPTNSSNSINGNQTDSSNFSMVSSNLTTVEKNTDMKSEEENGNNTMINTETNSNNLNNEKINDNENIDGGDFPHQSIQDDMAKEVGKAYTAAKSWGSYLFNVGKIATKTVTSTAIQVKDKINETPLLGDFSKEQDKFVAEKQEKKQKMEAAVPPWVGYHEEAAMKEQILTMSQDKRNFLRNPPAGVQFLFDFESAYPVALATLAEDPNLSKMRFELVPKQVSEENFWRNYFYRVSLIKQSTQLTTLAQQTGNTGEITKSNESSRRSSVDNGTKGESSSSSVTSSDYDKLSDIQDKSDSKQNHPLPVKEEDLPPESPVDHEFASDAFQDNGLNQDEIRKEMQLLGMKDQKDADLPEWERELQQELNEFEMVDDGDHDADIENEILRQLEQEES